MYIHTYIHTYLHIHTYTHTMYVCTYAYMHMYVYIYTCISVYTCAVYFYTHIYTMLSFTFYLITSTTRPGPANTNPLLNSKSHSCARAEAGDDREAEEVTGSIILHFYITYGMLLIVTNTV